jgi:cytochrome P450
VQLSPESRARLLEARRLQTSIPLEVDAFASYRRLLEAPGLTYDERRASWMAAHYADVQSVLLDSKTFSSQRTLKPDGSVDEVAGAGILGLDPPRHRHLRQLLAQAFTQKHVAELQPRIEAITDRLLDAMEADTTVNIVDALAFPLPVTVIAELLGIPLDDIPQFRTWSNELFSNDYAVRARTFGVFAQYFDGLIERRRSARQNDLISGLLDAEVDGERLSQRDITGACTLLLIAGHETTASLIPLMLWCLDENPAARAELVRHPQLLAGAIEESLRMRAVVHYMPRVVSEDVEFAGARLRAGDLVLPLFAAANLDARQFPDPDTFDMRRSPNRQFGFGHGIHLCLGASLARLETSVAIGRLLQRFPNLARDHSQPLELRPSAFVYSLQKFPVTLHR